MKSCWAQMTCALTVVATLAGADARASIFTRASPTGNPLPAAVTEIGGIVVDLIGDNGTRVVTQASASSLYVGFSGFNVNPLLIGTQAGFSPAVIAALGGGIAEAAVRITLFDGDTGAGDFDFGENDLLLNGLNFGDFSSVATQTTNGAGVAFGVSSLSDGFGFDNNDLDTGFFYSTDATLLDALYASLSGGSMTIEFELDDVDPDDNFYDFTQGLDGGLVNVGTGPVVTPPGSGAVPEPVSLAAWTVLSAAGLALCGRRI